MITHIRLKNFKSWKESPEVRLAPLTGFFGTNSSGKSSLLQMLLLLKQTAEQPDLDEVIFFGHEGSLVNLGNFREVIHGHKQDKLLELEFGCKLRKSHLIDFSVEGQEPRRSEIDCFVFNTVVGEEDAKPTVQNLEYIGCDHTWKIMWSKDPSYRITRNRDGTQFINGTSLGYAVLQNCYGRPYREYVTEWKQKFLKQISSVFEELFSQVHYLGPTRIRSQRDYTWEGSHPEHPGQWGDRAIDALLSARARNLKTLHEAEEVPIEQRISYWLQEMGLADSFSLDWTIDKTYEVRIRKTSSSPPVTLVDMGYGLGQFLPVLVLCYYAPEGSTLILEQPGIHLHPMAQADLADLLIEVTTERNLQILIESHSEHLLNRLQRRIAEEKISVDQTALHFCQNNDGVSTIDPLKMDKFGNIENWPPNFFGDEIGDLFAMTKAQRERQKRETELIEGTTVAPSKG